MSDLTQQYDGRLYTQAEVDRMVREARVDEIQRYDHMTYHSRDEFEEYIQQRIAELSKEDV